MASKQQAKGLEDLGFEKAADAVSPRTSMVMSLNGKTGVGKTRFLLTAPKPIALFNFDRKLEDSVLAELGVDKERDLYIMPVCIEEHDAEDLVKKEWDKFYRGFLAVMHNPEIPTVAIDTFCAVYESYRIRLFGKLSGVKSHHYGPVNTMMKTMLKIAEKYDKHVLLCHRLKKEYEKLKSKDDSAWNGNMIPKGWGDAQYEIPFVLEFFKDDDGYNAELTKSSVRPKEVEGRVFMNHEIDFATIAAEITDTTIVEWM